MTRPPRLAMGLLGLLVALPLWPVPPVPVVVLPPGDVPGPLVFDHPQVVRGSAGTRIVRRAGQPGPTVWIKAPGVVLEDVVVVGSGEGDRRSHTAVVVSASAILRRVIVQDAWSGLWIDGADGVSVEGFTFSGPSDLPFWQRGEGIRVSRSHGTRLEGLTLDHTADAVYVELSTDTVLSRVVTSEGRYGVHLMFDQRGRVEGLTTRRMVVGLMVMETSAWTVSRADLADGAGTGSAGLRLIKTRGLSVAGFRTARNASGLELADCLDGRFTAGAVEENSVAWTWSGDNSGTLVSGVDHRGNLVDAAAQAPQALGAPEEHRHGTPTAAAASTHFQPPQFDGNFWDSWKGWDGGDGRGDTPYRVNLGAAAHLRARPWEGLFLGSPWSQVSATLPGGEILDPRPLVRPRVRG